MTGNVIAFRRDPRIRDCDFGRMDGRRASRYDPRRQLRTTTPEAAHTEDFTVPSRTNERRQADRRTGVGRRTLGDRRAIMTAGADWRALPDRRLAERRVEARRKIADRRTSANARPTDL